MKPLFLILLLTILITPKAVTAQSKYMTKTGQVSFFSSTPIEDIDAKTQQVAAVVDFSTGQLAFSLPVKSFMFKRTLMQEHFNENYIESDKFPKATFSGKFVGLDAATLATAGTHTVQVEGDLTLHGMTHHVRVPASLELKADQLLAAATFPVVPADYNIEIPLLVRNSIAKVMTVRVALACAPVAVAVGKATLPSH